MSGSNKRKRGDDDDPPARNLRATQDRAERAHGAKATDNPKTRGQTKVAKDLEDNKITRKVTANNSAKPRKLDGSGGKAIWQGGRMNFSSDLYDKFWKKNAKSKCVKCKKPIDPSERSIDHIQDWKTYFRSQCDAVLVCTGEAHWNVYLTEELQEANEDFDNLAPMHGDCNSSKNASKDMDPFEPDFVGPCEDGEDCAVQPAKTR